MENKDVDDPTPNGKLPLIKIKIPKRAEESPAAEEEEEVKSHCCKECNKSFNSGKALGGHMSSAHVQANKDHASKKLSSKRKSPASPSNTCGLCGKNFQSKKSLFGHMRCHPNRERRRMDPPRIDSSSSSSSGGGDHHTDSGRHELGFRLMVWPTSKRGRAAADSDKKEKEQPIVAGQQLLKMLRDESSKEEDYGGRRIPAAVDGRGKEKVDFEIDPNDERVITAIQVLAGGKRENEKQPGTTSSSPEKFKCSECQRFFPTHQALGGHRASHNKFKMSVVNTVSRPHQTTPRHKKEKKLLKAVAGDTASSEGAKLLKAIAGDTASSEEAKLLKAVGGDTASEEEAKLLEAIAGDRASSELAFVLDLNMAPPTEENEDIGDSSNNTSSNS